MALTASRVLRLLAAKHSKDVFVAECKDGPTQSVRNHVRLDAWVMPRSWAHPEITAYEIKISRNDFLRDEKWQKYLELCHSLYFVAPKGVVDKFELPAEVGLLEVSANAKRLYTRKKAALRTEVVIPESLFRYVLMCRATIGEQVSTKADRLAHWKDWLELKQAGVDLGNLVSGRIAGVVREVNSDNLRLRRENESYAAIKKILDAAGIGNAQDWYARAELGRRLKNMRSGATEGLRRQLGEAQGAIANLVKAIDEDLRA